MSQKQFWLMKSEPDTFSIDDLKRDGTTPWEGVRNYQARNYMMNDMRVGDLVLFYHSNATPPGVIGIMQVSQTGVVDQLQFDKKSEYYDPKSSREKPRWICIEGKFVKKFAKLLSLDEIREIPKLQDMFILRKGSRLSITPVTKAEFEHIQKLMG